jgi:hypothetical protein
VGMAGLWGGCGLGLGRGGRVQAQRMLARGAGQQFGEGARGSLPGQEPSAVWPRSVPPPGASSVSSACSDGL